MAMATSKSFIKANSQTDVTAAVKQLDRLDSLRGSQSDQFNEDTFGALSNVRFAVFALGSSAYPNYCAFGKYVDNLLGELGGERLIKLATGDSMCGQEQAFKKWAAEAFRMACDTFCLDDDDAFLEASLALQTETLSVSTVRFVESKPDAIAPALTKSHNKQVTPCKLISRTNLHGDNTTRATLSLKFATTLSYQPGDHVGVYPRNRQELVDKIIDRLKGCPDPDTPVELQILKENHTSNGVEKTWKAHEKLPAISLREMLSRFLDITTPPSPNLLQHFAAIASDEEDQRRLNLLATDSSAYEDWRHWRYPHLLEVLEEFPSVQPYAPLLFTHLNVLQPKFYSISSSPSVYRDQLHLTVAVVIYRTEDGEGPMHYGVCSTYFQDVAEGEDVYLFVRSAPNFHLPPDPSRPVILVGPGTGIAPFRGFWQERYSQLASKINVGKMWLFFGCRQKELDLYYSEKQEMMKKGVFEKVFLALSREPNVPKTYVQDLALTEAAEIYQLLVIDHGHFYVCGDCTMAEHVYQTLKKIIQRQGQMSDADVEAFMLSLRDENRYHEDIFGITLRTAEVHNRSRESARIRMATQP